MLIDFSEDIDEREAWGLICSTWNILNTEISRLRDHLSIGKNLFLPKIALFGSPNAGKSTLFNKLVQDNRSIVTSVAGTTRDYISQIVNFKGETFELIDTAGIRVEGSDLIENMGIERSRELLDNCFYKVWVSSENEVKPANCDLLVLSHSDLRNVPRGTCSFGIDSGFGDVSFILEMAKEKFQREVAGDEFTYLASKYQNLVIELDLHRQNYQNCLEETKDIAVLDNLFRKIEDIIAKMTSSSSTDEVMEYVFSNFCIGK
jgi:tRNA modification GTPase